MTTGFGLVQWTPASKYFDWARGYYGCTNNQAITMDKELGRILWEVTNNKQWLNSCDPQHRSFSEFTQSLDAPYDLAMAFIVAYERPANPNQPIRGTRAEYWFNNLVAGSEPPPVPPPADEPDPIYMPDNSTGNALMHMLLSDALHGWK
jgi:hypothetical protein